MYCPLYFTEGANMKKALLVGINKYKDAPLRGCVNDCLMMYKVLAEKFQFDTKNINLITDYECTKQGILRELYWLTAGAKAGDILYFHYSGHGSQIVVDDWTTSNEADGLDEILCPVDLNWKDPLRDNDLNEIFKTVPKGVKVVVVLDCCHSGSGLRNTPNSLFQYNRTTKDWVNRFYPPPPSNILSNPKITIDEELGFIMPKFDSRDIQTQKNSFLNNTTNQGNAILIAGCRENQVSADAWVGDRYQGALTYIMVQLLHEFNFKIKFRSIVKASSKRLGRMGFTQRPQLECKKKYFNENFLFA